MQWLILLSNKRRWFMGSNNTHIQVEVAYALPDEQILMVVDTSEGAQIKDVITQSNILQNHPVIGEDIDKLEVGIFGKMAKLDQVVRDKDRIEIYRPLIADPKEVRKRRAAEGKRLKKGGAGA